MLAAPKKVKNMKKIPFVKMNGAGNDFVIIDQRQQQHNLTKNDIINICDRKIIGCDQLILISNSKNADCFMSIYNKDGSQSATCGNATRCVASIILNENKNSQKILIETLAGNLECWNHNSKMISVKMGIPKFNWQEIPLSKESNTQGLDILGYKFYCVNIGNPHAVAFFQKTISNNDLYEIGPKIENHQFFPEKTNVEFAVIKSDKLIEAKVWERGSGETKACGSGACAIAVTAIKNDFIKNNEVEIKFPGGSTFINWDKKNSVIMTGYYDREFNGNYEV